MTGTQAGAAPKAIVSGDADAETIETRFGKIVLKKDNPIVFPHGLLGMADKTQFFITEFPSEKLKQFKLLQSLDDYALSFITLPLDIDNSIISKDDLYAACSDVDIPKEDLSVVLIVSVHRSPAAVSLSVNARAPVLMDAKRRLAVQHVFPHDRYQVQHSIRL